MHPNTKCAVRVVGHLGSVLAELKKKHKDKQNQDRDKMIAAHANFIDIDDLVLENWREPGDMLHI